MEKSDCNNCFTKQLSPGSVRAECRIPQILADVSTPTMSDVAVQIITNNGEERFTKASVSPEIAEANGVTKATSEQYFNGAIKVLRDNFQDEELVSVYGDRKHLEYAINHSAVEDLCKQTSPVEAQPTDDLLRKEVTSFVLEATVSSNIEESFSSLKNLIKQPRQPEDQKELSRIVRAGLKAVLNEPHVHQYSTDYEAFDRFHRISGLLNAIESKD